MNKINTRKALNPAYRKHKPLRKDVNSFVENLLVCLKTIKLSEEINESEEHIKEPIKEFLKNTFYSEYYINTKDRIDLAIYIGKDVKSDVGVIIETKRPSNKTEFITTKSLNRKALHELLLYYLRERIDEKNNNIKHLIATNGYEWFLFKSDDFYRYFFKNKQLINEYEAFRDGKKDTTKNELFYDEIAKKYIAEIEEKLPFVHLDFTKKSIDEYEDAHLNTLYKIFSDVHILGTSFGNDSNQLNKTFYNELLHIIGLNEIKVKGKKIIYRKSEKDRDYGSILEDAIFVLEDRDYLRNIKSIENEHDKNFQAGLELTLTWINRILFLKLLESQLLSYHDNKKEYRFLNSEFIKGYDDLNDLFFSALAKRPKERHPKYKERFKYIPYLNSSLFERNELETEAFTISALNDEEIPILNQTVLKDAKGNRLKGKMSTLEYLFKFLDAYDFAADGTEGIEDSHETKTLINASVLGLIFEKINGYKEGSFYTPAYITMYMSRETLRRAIVHKFKEQENDQIENFEDLKAYTNRFFKSDDLKRFNEIVNSIKIIDPAVGSGHFLVSALNEIISIKNDLGILIDENGMPLKCDIVIDNDELYVTDKYGHLIDYKPNIKDTAIIQKTLFHEKQNIIENSLFGVDINPNSVKICRLRLWIELLKNAYYTEKSPSQEEIGGNLQTLPNIDINIKQGNSLISHFDLDDDLKSAFKGKDVKFTFTDYKNAVAEYKKTNNRERKYEVLNIINEVKNNFKSTLDNNFLKEVKKFEGKYLDEKQKQENLITFGQSITKKEKDRLKKLKKEYEKKLAEKEDILNNQIYKNAFEWRFEFPEVLDENGDFVGFDVVIGNPPYISNKEMHKIGIQNQLDFIKNNYLSSKSGNFDIYIPFIERGLQILKKGTELSFIIPNKLIIAKYSKELMQLIFKKYHFKNFTDFSGINVFEDASVYPITIRIIATKSNNREVNKLLPSFADKKMKGISDIEKWDYLNHSIVYDNSNIKGSIINKIDNCKSLNDSLKYMPGINGFQFTNYGKCISDGKKTEKSKRIVVTGVIDRYSILNKLTRYKGKEYKRPYIQYDPEIISEGKWELFCSPKIVIAGMTKIIEATLDEKGDLAPSVSVYSILGNINNIKYSLGVLNSKLINWYFKLRFQDKHLSGGYISMNTKLLEKINIVDNSNKSSLIAIVENILKQKKENPETDTSKLEAEIDQMVYQLYNLTPEEIEIIENSAK